MTGDQIKEKTATVSTRKVYNPFPGLRPFSIDESHLFFGREGQSDEVLEKLSRNRFVAVIGASGSGKSSLMFCGLVPILHGGFITEAGPKWRIITTRPGNSPVYNLSKSILQSEKAEHGLNGDDNYFQSVILSTLRASSSGMIEALKQLRRPADQNFLVLVDQFEELFRFKRNKNDIEAFNESLAFVKLILSAIGQKEVPIYVVLTMRSDFIGECSQFQELTKMINLSHYLIPQMTRENLYEAITGPVAVGGGKISPHLAQQLLNDVGDNSDQLPILQHALMRTWDYWEKLNSTETVLDMKHYDDIGRMERALSMHANEAYDELDHRQKEICESLFKTLTEKGGDNRGIRHPSPVYEIAAIAQASPEEIIKVVDVFRAPGRSFLSPSHENKLNENSIIDISHESLMRIWDRLRNWVDEEASSVQMYLRLSDAAARYQEGKTGLWRQPDLQLAINWKEKQKPTLVWAQRYHSAYERTMVYLETSIQAYLADEELKIKLQKRTIQRTRIFAAVLGTAAIISLGLTLYSFDQTSLAKSKTAEAEIQKKEAEAQKVEAEKQKEIAVEQTDEALRQSKIAEEQSKIAQQEKREADRQKELALWQQKIAVQKSKEAEEQKKLAEKSAKEALEQKQLALAAKDEALNLRMLSISSSMAVKSTQMTGDTDLKALLALQSYTFNKKYNGLTYNADIFDGIFYASKTLNPTNHFAFRGHDNAIRALAFNITNNKLYSCSSDGKIFYWGEPDSVKYKVFLSNLEPNRTMVISPDGRKIANASNAKIQIIETANPQDINLFAYHTQMIWAMAFSNDGKFLFSTAADNTLFSLSMASFAETQLVSGQKFKNIAVSKDDKTLYCVLENGNIALIDIQNKSLKILNIKQDQNGKISMNELTTEEVGSSENQATNFPVLQLALSNSGNMMATGDKNGIVRLWDLPKFELRTSLTGHTTRINDLKFGPGDKQMASASSDGTIRLWHLNDLKAAPYVLRDHEAWAMSVVFDAEGKTLFGGYVDGWIQFWPTSPDELASKLCPMIKRNLTRQEWSSFVAEDVPYEKTCIK